MSPSKMPFDWLRGSKIRPTKRAEPNFTTVNTIDGVRNVDTTIPDLQGRYASKVIGLLSGATFLLSAWFISWVATSQHKAESLVNYYGSKVIHLLTGEKSALDESIAFQNQNASLQRQVDGVQLMTQEMTDKDATLKQRDQTISNLTSINQMNAITIKNLQATVAWLKAERDKQLSITASQFNMIDADNAEIGRLKAEKEELTKQIATLSAGRVITPVEEANSSQKAPTPASSTNEDAGVSDSLKVAPVIAAAPKIRTEDGERQTAMNLMERDSVRPEQSTQKSPPVATQQNGELNQNELKNNTASWMVAGGSMTKIDLTMVAGVPSVAMHTEAWQDAQGSTHTDDAVMATPGDQLAMLAQAARNAVAQPLNIKPVATNLESSVSTVPNVINKAVPTKKPEIAIPSQKPVIAYKELQTLVQSAQSSLIAMGAVIHTSQVSKGRFKVWMTHDGNISTSFFTDTPKYQGRLTRKGMKQWASETMNYFHQIPLIKEVAAEQQMSLNKQDALNMEGVLFLRINQSSWKGKVRFVASDPKHPDGHIIDFTMPFKDITKANLGKVLKDVRAKLDSKSRAPLA